jgi:hypothetical protein
MIRYLPTVLTVLGLCLLAVSGVGYWLEDPDPGVTLDQTVQEFPACVAGEPTPLVLKIKNANRVPARVCGLTYC